MSVKIQEQQNDPGVVSSHGYVVDNSVDEYNLPKSAAEQEVTPAAAAAPAAADPAAVDPAAASGWCSSTAKTGVATKASTIAALVSSEGNDFLRRVGGHEHHVPDREFVTGHTCFAHGRDLRRETRTRGSRDRESLQPSRLDVR